ncbi:MAG: hypothetical protein ISR58_09315 [Anaerolineales bacterium]|nr:hypothetical protein [Chloroflexota bacterium]MBL6981375.1 hypothetical protein [Anaerolineales bacterium]
MALLHSRLANTVVMYMILMSLWGFWRFFRKQGMDSSYWGAVVIAEVLILIQGAIGVFMRINGILPARGWFHILYGIVAAIALPGVYLYTKGSEERRDMLFYAAIFLFLIGISLRAMSTGGLG